MTVFESSSVWVFSAVVIALSLFQIAPRYIGGEPRGISLAGRYAHRAARQAQWRPATIADPRQANIATLNGRVPELFPCRRARRSCFASFAFLTFASNR